MKKGRLKNTWQKLDNTAKIFSLDDKNNTNTFRYSAVLKKNIDKEILYKALNKSLYQYPSFKVKFGTGLFWHYLEFNSKQPVIRQESEIPCQHINFKENNDYLFKVTYYKKKINLDIFHVLTDGTGAIQFLKSIIYNYLNLKYGLTSSKNEETITLNCKDQYLKNYNKKLKFKNKFKPSYQIPGKINRNLNNTYHYILDISNIKRVCKKHGVTITEYLTSVYIYSLYLTLYNKKSKKEILITVPVNLRNYYKVKTLSNFFVCMTINPKIVENNITTLDEILKQVHQEFSEKTKDEKVKKYLSRDVKLGTNILIRLVPLFMKKLFIKFGGTLVMKNSTSTLSNVGIIDIDDEYKSYIDNILVLVMPGRFQKIKCTICSFDNKLNVTINSNINDLEFQRVFYSLLKEHINNIKLKSNNSINLIK